MIYIFLADGFEEIEALAPLDFLLRAGVQVKTVATDEKLCRGTHNIRVMADISSSEIVLDENLEGIILPGGLPGADNLNENEIVQNAIDFCIKNNKIVAAICAAPFILGKKGVLQGKKATCYPGFEEELKDALVLSDGVVRDGNIITAKGAGVAWEFGAAIATAIVGEEKSLNILRGIQWKK